MRRVSPAALRSRVERLETDGLESVGKVVRAGPTPCHAAAIGVDLARAATRDRFEHVVVQHVVAAVARQAMLEPSEVTQVARAARREARRKARHQAARAAAPAAQASARGPAAARKKRKAPTAADDPPSAPAGDSSVHPCNTETPGNLNTLWDYAAVPPGASWSCVATHVCSPERAADPMSRRREQRIGEPAAP